jgi:hypothetical protein
MGLVRSLWLAGAGRAVGAGPADHRAPQVGQGPVAVEQLPPYAVHGNERGLGYFLCHRNIIRQEHSQLGEGPVVLVVERGQRLVSLPSVSTAPGAPARCPAHAPAIGC